MKHSIKEKEKIIKNYMEKLDLTEEEALDLYAYDFEDGVNLEAEELNRRASLLPRWYERIVKDDSETPKKSRPRKPDETKAAITSYAEEGLTALGVTDCVTVPEKTIDFTYNNRKFGLKLTKHNTYKGIAESKATKRKVDMDKAAILTNIVNIFSADSNITNILVQTETKINFNVAETNYTLALTAHRK